jgi:SAM-dependent methyltransferase
MQLSELVAYRRHLNEITQDGSADYLRREIDPVIYSVANHRQPNANHVASLKHAKSTIVTGLQDFQQSMNQIKTDVDQEIEQNQAAYLARSYGLYQDMCRGDTPEYILDRRIHITSQTQDFVLSRIRRRDTWKYPAVIIRPGREDWIDHMVAFDPLYVVDHHTDLLSPAKARFNQTYQSRVRWITVVERDDHSMLQALPDSQIGFAMAWNFFHYKPFEVIKQYLAEVYQKLRPGGVFAFSINDGDLPGGVANAERMFMCYTPGSMIMSIAQRIGFDIESRHELDRSVTWIELHRPGEKDSLRGGQTLAKIMPHPNVPKIVVDNASPESYTTNEREILIQQAIDLNIDTPDRLRNDYSFKQLRKAIKQRKSQ